jgi:NAD+--asparagine ADP-ribosyltransferase
LPRAADVAKERFDTDHNIPAAVKKYVVKGKDKKREWQNQPRIDDGRYYRWVRLRYRIKQQSRQQRKKADKIKEYQEDGIIPKDGYSLFETIKHDTHKIPTLLLLSFIRPKNRDRDRDRG